jgi:hypothetical protein
VKCVVLGHQKSGTTAFGALLAQCAGGGYANDPLYAIDRGKGGAAAALLCDGTPLAEMVEAHRRLFCRTILKDPDLTFVRGQLELVFPAAALVHVVRNPFTTIRSIADRLELSAEHLLLPADQVQLPNLHWRLIVSGKLPDIGRGTIAEILALRCAVALDAARTDLSAHAIVRYEDFCAAKKDVIEAMASSLDLPVRSDIGGAVDRQFQTRGKARVDLQSRLGSRTIEVIASTCGAANQYFDYTLPHRTG